MTKSTQPKSKPTHTKLTKKQLERHYDQFLNYYYCQPCAGCPDGHPSFWKTIIESYQWECWQKEQNERQTNPECTEPMYDMAEVEELGVMSPEHWKDFLHFTYQRWL